MIVLYIKIHKNKIFCLNSIVFLISYFILNNYIKSVFKLH